MVKGFKKDGKFRPTGKRNKSSLSKKDLKKNTRSKVGITQGGKCHCGTKLPNVRNNQTPYQYCSEECKKNSLDQDESELKKEFDREKKEHDGIFQDGELLDMSFDDWIDNELDTVTNVIDDNNWKPYIDKLNRIKENRNSRNKETLDETDSGEIPPKLCAECNNELLTSDTIENQLCENCDEEHY